MSYVRLLRTHGAAGYFVTTALGRLGIAMYGLSIILTAAAVYGDYVRAGLVGGAFAGAEAVGGPVSARIADRLGPRRTPVVAHLLLTAALASSLLERAPIGAVVACAAAAGASVPQLGALAAARWSRLLHGDPSLETALSLESVANDVAFIAGPLAVSAVASLLGPAASTATACALVVVAGLVCRPTRPSGRPGGRAGRGLGALGLANLMLGLLFGTTQLAVAALAHERAGLYYLTMSVGSLLSSAGYGLVRWRGPAWRRFAAAGLLVAGGAAGLVAAGPTGSVIAALFVVGLGVGPLIVVTGTLVERRAAPGRLTQAFALMSALSAAGIALSGPLGGAAVQARGAVGGFALLVAYGLVLAALGALIGKFQPPAHVGGGV
jgi:predicted MFS family arabinose efflux permease